LLLTGPSFLRHLIIRILHLLPRPFILHRPRDIRPERPGGVKRPMRVAQEFPGDEDRVGKTGGDNLLGLGRVGNEADGAGGDADLSADGSGKRCLVTGAEGDVGIGGEEAGGAVDEVDADLFEAVCERDRLAEVPPTLDPIGSGNADEERQLLRPHLSYCPSHPQGKALPVFGRAAAIIGSVVGQRREELVEKVAVGHVDFDHLKTGGQGSPGGVTELRLDRVQVVRRELAAPGIRRRTGRDLELPAASRAQQGSKGYPRATAGQWMPCARHGQVECRELLPVRG
jgi:hypothetical protein